MAEVKPKGAAAKLSAIQSEIHDVEKTGEVAFKGTRYKHFQEHGLLQVLKPLLKKYACAIVFDVRDVKREGNHLAATCFLTLIDTDQDRFIEVNDHQVEHEGKALWVKKRVENPEFSISAQYPTEAIDSSDKATNKALTNGNKYALQKFFQVPTEKIDDVEGSDESHNTPKSASGPGNGRKAARVEAVIQKASKLVSDGFDANKVVAKIQSSYGKQTVAELTVAQLDQLDQWIEEQSA